METLCSFGDITSLSLRPDLILWREEAESSSNGTQHGRPAISRVHPMTRDFYCDFSFGTLVLNFRVLFIFFFFLEGAER